MYIGNTDFILIYVTTHESETWLLINYSFNAFDVSVLC